MGSSGDKWAEFHEKALPYEQAIVQEPFKTLIDRIASFVREHNIPMLLETGFGTGYVMICLAKLLPGVDIAGIDASPGCRERMKQLAEKQGLFKSRSHVQNMWKEYPDIFEPRLYETLDKTFLVYHQGLLEHFSNDKIKELLELQTAHSFAVIFSVPAKDYGRQDFGDERLLTLKEWEKILEPFEVLQIRYYDDNRHILGILKGGLYAGE